MAEDLFISSNEFEYAFLAGSDTNCDNDRGFIHGFSLLFFVIKEFSPFRRLFSLKFVKADR